jgi:hypothetical protein
MTLTQLADAPTTRTRPIADTQARGTHLLDHPRGRGFSVVSRLAREVQAPAAPPRHRLEDPAPELVGHLG